MYYNTLFQNFFQYKSQEMHERTAERMLYALSFVTDQYKTHEMRGRAIERWQYGLGCVLDQYNTQRRCESTVESFVFLIIIRLKKCAEKLLKEDYMH